MQSPRQPRSRPHGARGQRGAVLVHVAVALVGLLGFSALAIDYGVLWVSRGQAQNAADAAALAGGLSLAFTAPGDVARAQAAASSIGVVNAVWNAAPAITSGLTACPVDAPGTTCFRANAFRNGEFASTPLPTFFARLVGVNEQGVRATATVRVAIGNTTDCMRPWGVVDLWQHVVNPVEQYDHWDRQGQNVISLTPHDIYIAPTTSTTGTGFQLPRDFGRMTTLKIGNPQSTSDAITPGWFLPLDLPDGRGGYVTGGDAYRANIARCVGLPVRIGDYLPTETGNMIGPTAQGVADLVAQDSGASWDAGQKKVVGTCAPGCAPFSPRIVPLPVFDMDDFQWRRASGDWSVCPAGGKCVRIVNILGFFVSHMNGNDVVGYLMRYPGTFVTGSPNVGEGSSFLTSVALVR